MPRHFSSLVAITCWFIDCIYNEWSAWSGTCYQVRRTRSVRQEIRKSKMVVGGCAGLNILNCKPEVETKNLGVCLRKLAGYYSCSSGACQEHQKINSHIPFPSFTSFILIHELYPTNHYLSQEHAIYRTFCLLFPFLNPAVCYFSNLRSINFVLSPSPLSLSLSSFCIVGASYKPPWPFPT